MVRMNPLRVLALFSTLALPASSPAALAAQEGSIAYTHSVRLDLEIPEALRERMETRGGNRPGGPGGLPEERVTEFVLLFNAAESLMKPVPSEGGRRAGPPVAGDRRGGMLARLRMRSASRRARETLVESYVHYDDGRVVESRRFLGRTFLIDEQRPAPRWKLSGEQAEYLGYVVQKATAEHDSSTVEAWFTPQIPVAGGPAGYGGLPGMILVVSVDGGNVQYNATAVSLTPVAEGVIVPPDDGERVSRARYEEIVAEKLEELRTVGYDRP